MKTEPEKLKTILLVEDDPQDVELTLAALDEHHRANQVEGLQDGAPALDDRFRRGEFKTRASSPPIMVLPKVNGLEVLQIIKADAHLKHLPVVVLTSSRETPDLRKCYQHGVNTDVVKPVDFSSNSHFEPERGCVVLDQPQPIEKPQRFRAIRALRLVSDTAALRQKENCWDFSDFMNAVRQPGLFWAAVNEPPLFTGSQDISIPSGECIPPGTKVMTHEISTPHPASGG